MSKITPYIEPYKKLDSIHSYMLVTMLANRGMAVDDHLKNLPKHGLIATIDNEVIAAGFLREVEGDFAILDSLITNPQVHAQIRTETLDVLVSKLIEMAKDMGLTKIVAFTEDANTLMRASKHGFDQLDQFKVIALSL